MRRCGFLEFVFAPYFRREPARPPWSDGPTMRVPRFFIFIFVLLFVFIDARRGDGGSGGGRRSRRSGRSVGGGGRSAGRSLTRRATRGAAPKVHKLVHTTYKLNLQNGKTYIGQTSNLRRRLQQHFNGRGAMWTQKHPPKSVVYVKKHTSLKAAKRAETREYYAAKKRHGAENVRGAGHTRSTP